jgi:NCAIR mutase (PurE)-related protein
MSKSPFDHLRSALTQGATTPELDGVRADLDRADRCGLAEVVYCKGKTPEAVLSACRRLLTRNSQVLATRCTLEMAEQVGAALRDDGLEVRFETGTLVVRDPHAPPPDVAGSIGILTAGTSDWPAASVAKLVAESAGCAVLVFQDCGVAGLHRLVEPLEALVEADVAAIIVAAGMDGVLPSVVAGLVDIPVIGLPTSTGYGHGGGGEGALTTMLQACAPGVAVVNIDNGVGAGAMAALIAKRVNRG